MGRQVSVVLIAYRSCGNGSSSPSIMMVRKSSAGLLRRVSR